MTTNTEAKDIVLRLLANGTDEAIVNELVAPDATYISLNKHNPDLKAIEPWCGLHERGGPKALYEGFAGVNRYWITEKFEVEVAFADAPHVAVFGTFRYRSRTLGAITESPFAVWAQISAEGKVTFLQFMEDTLSSATSFRKSGRMVYASNPDGGEIVIGK